MISLQNSNRRRNGKLQACEPCRNSKQRCSHDLPHCKRCVAGNKTKDCYYHEAPMTKNFDAANPTALRQSPTSSKRALSSCSGSQTPTSSHRTKSLKESTELPPLLNHGRLFKAPHRWGTSTSYGSTSFSAIFRENQDKFGKDIFDAPHGATVDASAAETQKTLNRCLRILHALPSEDTCTKLLDRFVHAKDTLLAIPLMRVAITSFWREFRHKLAEPRSDRNLQEIADVLKTNQNIPWTCIGDPAFGEWPDLCCGRQLRWEMLGLMCTTFSLAFMHLQASEPLIAELPEAKNGRQVIAWKMKQCAEMCLESCNESNTMNEFVIMLMRGLLLLDNLFWGNDSAQAAKRRSELVMAIYNSGLWVMPKSPMVTATTEYRRRIFMVVYDVDKEQSCFSGVPPFIHKRHCVMQAPLDLSDDQLFGDVDDIVQAASQLDSFGWNTEGKIHEVTLGRARFEFSKIKEDIQDLSLRTDGAATKEGVDELLKALEDTVATFPSQLQYKDPAPEVDGMPGNALYTQSMLHLEYLQLRFYIERLRRRRTSQALFDTAREMVETITHIFLCEAHAYAHWFDWLLIVYGFPAVGVLILTAVTKFRSNFRTPNSSMPSSQIPSSSQLPPSSQMSTFSSNSGSSQPRNPSQLLGISFQLPAVVELLNNFFNFLAWSRSANGNQPPSKIETQLRKLTGILQQSLSHFSSQVPRSANSSFGGINMVYPRSANVSFGSVGASSGDAAVLSQAPSFELNSSSTTSGTATEGNTQMPTPIDLSFDAAAPLLGFDENGFQSDLDWTLQVTLQEPVCASFLTEVDFTIPQMEVDAQPEEFKYSQYLTGFSSSFGPESGISQ